MALHSAALRNPATAHRVAAFTNTGVFAVPCHTLEALVDDPHLQAVGLLREEQHDLEGPIRTIRPTIVQDGVPADPGHPARPIGCDTRAVPGEAGYNAAEIDALIASGTARALS